MMKLLVIGYGSIGRRHAQNIALLGHTALVLTRYPDDEEGLQFISSIREASDTTHCVICTPTAQHFEDFKKVVKNTGCKKVLIEKPVAKDVRDSGAIASLAAEYGIEVFVAYNMRFRRAFEKVRDFLDFNSRRVRMVEAKCGQYLPDWRPGSDYRKSYSADAARGGGVALDLSHEVDYIIWLFGMPSERLFSLKTNISSLELKAEDYFHVIFKYDPFIVSLQTDYIRKLERSLKIIGENEVLVWYDMINQQLIIDGVDESDAIKENRNDAYIKELEAFIGQPAAETLCTLEEGIRLQSQIV